jgi:hypothetical protein
MNLTLTTQQIELIIQVLSLQPFNQVASTISDILTQVNKQSSLPTEEN